jgi:hypothetical protein
MSIKHYRNPDYEKLLQANDIADFEALWKLDIGWFEEPNQRRGGWSGVSKYDWKAEDGTLFPVFIKRQENHNAKTWQHPIKGVPTFSREMDNILQYQKCDAPTLTPLFFEQRKSEGNDQAILITVSLEGYQSLEEWIEQWRQQGWPDAAQKKRIISKMAKAIAKLHAFKLQHNCLYPKHLFLKIDENGIDVRFIDLEKTRQKSHVEPVMLRDLGSFYRHMGGVFKKESLYFMQVYAKHLNVNKSQKVLWKMLCDGIAAKKK